MNEIIAAAMWPPSRTREGSSDDASDDRPAWSSADTSANVVFVNDLDT
jgi:hypothetical protein